MLNIRNLKLSKIFWTRITTYNEMGQIKVILVKKNLFEGYAIIDEFGNKRKSFYYEENSKILDVSKTLTKSNVLTDKDYQKYAQKIQYENSAVFDSQEKSYKKRLLSRNLIKMRLLVQKVDKQVYNKLLFHMNKMNRVKYILEFMTYKMI